MTFNPDIHHRRSIRLRHYDYSRAGSYFVMVCTQNRESMIGNGIDLGMDLNSEGRMVERWWEELNPKFPEMETDEYIVMPNHFHGIVMIGKETVGAAPRGRPDPEPFGEKGHPHRGAPAISVSPASMLRRSPISAKIGHISIGSGFTGPKVIPMQKTIGQVEAQISTAMIQFEKDYMGRGPVETKTYIIDDMILVRLKGVLTPAEQQLAKNPAGTELIKKVRANLLEQARALLVETIEKMVPAKVSSLHTDISTKTGERVIIFALSENLGARFSSR